MFLSCSWWSVFQVKNVKINSWCEVIRLGALGINIKHTGIILLYRQFPSKWKNIIRSGLGSPQNNIKYYSNRARAENYFLIMIVLMFRSFWGGKMVGCLCERVHLLIAHSYARGLWLGAIRVLCFPSRWLHHLSVSIKPKLGGMGDYEQRPASWPLDSISVSRDIVVWERKGGGG